LRCSIPQLRGLSRGRAILLRIPAAKACRRGASALLGKLTDGDITLIEGKRDQLAGKVRERYGIVGEEAERP